MEKKQNTEIHHKVTNHFLINNLSSHNLKSVVLQVKKGMEENHFVLVQGLNFNQLEFEAFTNFFCNHFFRVTSREKFRQIVGDGFTTLVGSKNFTLLGHVEVDYVPGIQTPDIGFLFCQVPPEVEGGETFLVDGIEMFNTLPKTLQERFKNEQVTYEFLWEPQRWQAQYGVQTSDELCKRLDKMENVRYKLKDNWLHLFYTTSGIVNFNDGTTAFSNAILGHLPKIDHPSYREKTVYTKDTNQVYWENGEPFSKETIIALIDAHDQHKQYYRWEKGDLLIFDNFRYLHGREETVESCERILFSRFGYLDIDIE